VLSLHCTCVLRLPELVSTEQLSADVIFADGIQRAPLQRLRRRVLPPSPLLLSWHKEIHLHF
jgi:hypothetical protein